VSITDLTLCHNDTFLIGSHNDGKISVFNIHPDHMTVQTDVAPFGFVEEIWGVEKFLGYEGAETEELFLPTTDGLYVCMIT
jgi:hypothetical protein